MSDIDYVVWNFDVPEGICTLDTLENVEKRSDLYFNISRAEGFPEDATFQMDPETPNDTQLADRLQNTNGFIVVSAKVVDFLKSNEVTKIEYLPVKVLDHKKRPVAEQYYIANPLEPVDCLDVEACEPTMDRITEGKIKFIEQLVLDEDKVDTSRKLFACDRFHSAVLIQRSLADAMDEAGFTGNEWVEIDEYDG